MRDPNDGHTWAALGRLYLERRRRTAPGRRRRYTRGPTPSTARIRARAGGCVARARRCEPGKATAPACSACRSERAGARAGSGAGSRAARRSGPVPVDLRLSPVLEELGENLLRACPTAPCSRRRRRTPTPHGTCGTCGCGPTLRRATHLDPAFRVRAAADLRLGAAGRGDGWLAALVERRPACAAFERPPDGGAHLRWARPLVRVAARHPGDDRVPPRDFAALRRLGGSRSRAWSALALYARDTRALCEALGRLPRSRWSRAVGVEREALSHQRSAVSAVADC